MINVRFKYGCAWVRLPHDAFPLMREPFPNHKLGTANGSISGGSTPPCGIVLTHSSAVGILLPIPAGRSQVGTAFQHHVAAQKGCESLTYPFLALISINDNIPARTTWRANPVSVEAWQSGLKRQFAKLVKSFYRLSQVRILLLPLRVAQFTLLPFDRFRL